MTQTSAWISINAGEPSLNEVVEVKTADGAKFTASLREGFGAKFTASMREGFIDSAGMNYICWVADTDEHPECWHDGTCWESNADEQASDPVIAYRRLN